MRSNGFHLPQEVRPGSKHYDTSNGAIKRVPVEADALRHFETTRCQTINRTADLESDSILFTIYRNTSGSTSAGSTSTCGAVFVHHSEFTSLHH
jgi:hypothetical protein